MAAVFMLVLGSKHRHPQAIDPMAWGGNPASIVADCDSLVLLSLTFNQERAGVR